MPNVPLVFFYYYWEKGLRDIEEKIHKEEL